jgi:hypothetical protein
VARDLKAGKRICLKLLYLPSVFKIRHRDELSPTCPESVHFQRGINLVHIPRGSRGAKFLVLARKDVSGYVEGRAVTKAGTEPVCRFILEEIVNRYGAFE